MQMNAYELMTDPYFVSRNEARLEIEDHHLSFYDFVQERGERDEYSTKEVLEWLGY
jgi:hypothetical protein